MAKPLPVSICSPACRMLILVAWTDDKAGKTVCESLPVVALRQVSPATGHCDDDIPDPEPIIVDEGLLTPVRESNYAGVDNAVYTVVAAPWKPSKDEARLKDHFDLLTKQVEEKVRHAAARTLKATMKDQ